VRFILVFKLVTILKIWAEIIPAKTKDKKLINSIRIKAELKEMA